MEGPRAARKEELQDLIDLINYVFRVSASKEPDMHICFPLFISENNLDNLLVYADRKTGKPISHLGLWINDFSYFGESMKIGYIGSVCTHPDYRGQGLASKLLDVAFQQLEQNGVDLLLVSGSRSLYVRAGCRVVGVVNWYTIPKKEQDVWFDVTVDPPNPSTWFPSFCAQRGYNSEVRLLFPAVWARNPRFTLLLSAEFPWHTCKPCTTKTALYISMSGLATDR